MPRDGQGGIEVSSLNHVDPRDKLLRFEKRSMDKDVTAEGCRRLGVLEREGAAQYP